MHDEQITHKSSTLNNDCVNYRNNFIKELIEQDNLTI